MKKLIATFLITAMVMTMTACGGTGTETAQASSASSEAAAVSSASSEAASAVSQTEETSEASQTEAASAESKAESTAEETSEESITQIEEEEKIPIVDEDLEPGECVEIGNYKGLEVQESYVEPTEEDIETAIQNMLAPVAVEDENATVVTGDTANIDYVGKIDGEAFDGGTSAGYDLVIGSGTFIPGFEDGVIGMKKGEVKDIDVTFPENYGNQDYAGKAAVFTVTLNEIKKKPELNDEWVKTSSGTGCQTVEELRAYLMDYYQTNLRRSATSSMQLELWQKVLDNSKVLKIPQSYYDRAAANFDRLNTADAEEYGMTLDEFMEANGVTEEYYKELKDAYSRESATNTLLCYAIWEVEGLTEESEEYTKAVAGAAEGTGKTVEELIEEFGEETITNYGKTYAVLDRIMSYATILPADTAEEKTEN